MQIHALRSETFTKNTFQQKYKDIKNRNYKLISKIYVTITTGQNFFCTTFTPVNF